jgi:hypothetical protein
MSEPEPKGPSKPPDAFREVDGFGKPESRPGSTARPDPGAVRPVAPVPNAGMARPDGGERKGRNRFTQPLSEQEQALSKDAAEQARQLKRRHRRSTPPIPGDSAKWCDSRNLWPFARSQVPSPTGRRPGGLLTLPGGVPEVRSGQSCTSSTLPATGS